MRDLDIIRLFANPLHFEGELPEKEYASPANPLLAALEALDKNKEWLADRSLVERVVARLETVDPQSEKECAKTAAVYMKIIGLKEFSDPIRLSSVEIRISAGKSVDLPKGLLTAKSPAFRSQLDPYAPQTIDLSGQVSEDVLAYFVTYLTTGRTNFISNDNAIDLLLLAKEYKLTELTMQCLEHVLTHENKWKNLPDSECRISTKEYQLRSLLEEAKSCFITISRSIDRTATIKMWDGSKKEHWDCLERLHNFVPVTHLELTENKDLDKLLAFAINNPNIVSLNLGASPDVSEEYLEKLSRHLPQLDIFYIQSSDIKNIPMEICERVTTLGCNYCQAITWIVAPKATTLNCIECPVLAMIDAPNLQSLFCNYCSTLTQITTNAITVDCYNCNALTRIVAPKATTLYCNDCSVLKFIIAPSASTLDCYASPRLTDIEAPNVTSLNCSGCHSLTCIDAPNAKTIFSSNCHSLQSIVAAKAKAVYCSNSRALTSIYAPNVLKLCCCDCNALTTLDAPRAEIVDCSACQSLINISTSASSLECFDCSSLVKIVAPKALTVQSNNCPALSEIEAQSAVKISCYGCPSLSREVKARIFNTIQRNIIKIHYTNLESLIKHLSTLYMCAEPMYGIADARDSPLSLWFFDTQKLVIPEYFDSEAEKARCQSSVNEILERLFSIAHVELGLDENNLNWFKSLKKFNSLHEQMSRILWLGHMLACYPSSEGPLSDPDAIPTLTAIGNLADPFTQAGSTHALFSVDENEGSTQNKLWRRLKENRPEHLLLVSLFFSHAQIEYDTADQLLKGLASRYYKNHKIINPIVEMAYLLSQEPTLTARERKRIFKLTLNAPDRHERENAKAFDRRVKSYRNGQPKWITACRDLLLFKRGHELRDVKNQDELLTKHKKICQKIFGVRDELLQLFSDTFKTKRYPNALFTYAARLQTLPANERTQVTELLGEFVNGHLNEEFPESRYELSINPHLEMIFGQNALLLEKWKEPFEVSLMDEEAQPQNPDDIPKDFIRDQIKLAIENKHLGQYQENLHPALLQALNNDVPLDIQMTIDSLSSRLEFLKTQLQSEPPKDKKALRKELITTGIKLFSLKVLMPDIAPSTIVENLRALRKLLPDGLEFKNDVKGMMDALDPSKAAKGKWVKVQTSDLWDDLLLMGTEIKNSCQRIDGDPDLNKCLLAYILDGKNKLMIVRDSEGKIAARSVLRILWNSRQNQPVLFMERIYTASADKALSELILKGCVGKARRMQLPLVASPNTYPEGKEYEGVLDAIGGPAPYEYVDALHKMMDDGEFSIQESRIVYTPEDERTFRRNLKRGRDETFMCDEDFLLDNMNPHARQRPT